MDLFFMLLTTAVVPIFYIWPSRIISMTYKTFGRSITIKNGKLAHVLIAKKNTWGIATDPDKRNKMSFWGIVSYMWLLPQLASEKIPERGDMVGYQNSRFADGENVHRYSFAT